jgi:SNF2 family DNA or RNA helicase
MHEDDKNEDLFLFYWISIYPLGKDPDDDEDEDENKNLTDAEISENQRLRKIASSIKRNVDLREIYKTRELKTHIKRPLKNDEVYKRYKEKETYCPSLTHNFMEIYYSEWEEQEHNVNILFYRITEKWRLCKEELDIPEDKSLLTAIHRDITLRNNLVDDWDNDFEEIMQDMTRKLDEKKYYNLEELSTKEIKTKLYSYQLSNVNSMIDSENNPKIELITDDHIFFYKDGTRIYNYYRDEDTTYEKFEKTKIKGMIVMDQVGIGKSLQALALINEQNYIRNQNKKEKLKTIIICPDHLKEHWEQEIEKHILSLSDIYTHVETFTSFLKMSIKEGDYDRVIVDEVHELYSKSENEEIFNKITDLKFTYKHGLTGTAFPVENSLFYLLLFLTDVDYDIENMERLEAIQHIYPKIFLRNTLENIEAEISLPPLKETISFLDFSKKERILYDTELQASNDADETFLRKLCCDIMINFKDKNIKITTLSDFISIVLDDYLSKYKAEEKIYDELIIQLEIISNEIKIYKTNIDNINMIRLNEHYILIKNKIERQSEIVNNKKKSYDFLNSQICSEKECPVCLDQIEDTDEYNMLPCGHIFCVECFEVILYQKTKCDVCNKNINKGQITQISNYTEKKMNYGTKINKLIILVNDLVDKKKNGETDSDKLVIYSQFPEMLDELVEILSSEGIKSLIFNNQMDIKKFKNDDNFKCLIISSTKNAAGMDLSFVNNILIYEPIKGNKTYLRDVEKQIIGRIYRINQTKVSNVYKFIINDTIEKKIYNELQE